MKTLKRWQEPIYAMGIFGPVLMHQIVTVYLLSYYSPGLTRVEIGAITLSPALAVIFGMVLSRLFSALVPVPIASWTDNLRTRWGRRYPIMILGFIPTLFSFLLLWYPPITGSRLGPEGHWGNAVYLTMASALYFFFHTLIILPYLASLSELFPDEETRVRVTNWQSAFAAGGFLLTLVVAPILFNRLGIRGTIWLLAPLFLTFLGPLWVIKESSTLETASDNDQAKVPDLAMWESTKLSLEDHSFRIYLLAITAVTFGLTLFLGGISSIGTSLLGLSSSQTRWITAVLFAPVPIMLLLFNRLVKRKGLIGSLKIGLLVFVLTMLLYPMAWTRLNLPISPLLVGAVAGILASFSIGVFFSMAFAFPAHFASEKDEQTDGDRAGMYFALQWMVIQLIAGLALLLLRVLLNWRFGALAISPIAAVTCLTAYFLFTHDSPH